MTQLRSCYVDTIANQLSAKHLPWREYAQDMGNNAHRDGTVKTAQGPVCGHPALRGVDLTDSTGPANDSYATRHNPFMYFESVIRQQEVLRGHDWPKCQDGTPGRLPRVDQFLKVWIPQIMVSPAYKQNGLILIMFDESGDDSDAGACCGEVDSLGFTDPSHPNLNEVGVYGPGGGRVGAIVLSRYVKAGTVSKKAYNHYSQLRSFEDLFGLKHLGDAQQPQVHSFGPDVYTRPSG